MFNTICIKFDQKGFPTDLGLLAESLLFYKQVIILGQPDVLPLILNNVSKDTLIELLLTKKLRLCILRNFLAVSAKNTSYGPIPDNILQMQLATSSTEDQIFSNLYNSNNRRGYSRKILQNIMPHIEFVSYPIELTHSIKSDLYDDKYTKNTFIEIIKNYIPDLSINPKDFVLEFTEAPGSSFGFKTNLDFNKLNRRVPDNPASSKVNPVAIVTSIQSARGDLHLASTYDSEILTHPFSASLISLKFNNIHEKISKNINKIYQFNDFTLNDGYAIREAINSGQYSFDEFVKIINKADKFREWIHMKQEDTDLIKEYYESVTRKTWIEKLPNKIIRWGFFTGVGVLLDTTLTGGIATIVATGLNISDAFLLDKILSGWKPNMFIEKELKKINKN